MSSFYEELPDIRKYSNFRRLFWKFFRCMCKQLDVSKRRDELEYDIKFKLISTFVNSLLYKSLPWERFCSAYRRCLVNTKGLRRDTDVLHFMKNMESMFETIPHDYEIENRNISLTTSECFTILFLFTYKKSDVQLNVLKILPRILLCLNSNQRFVDSIKQGMDTYLHSYSSKSDEKMSDDIEYLIHKYIANIRGVIDIDNDVIRAGVYNDICILAGIGNRMNKINSESFKKAIESLYEHIDKEEIVKYFQDRTYNACDMEIIDDQENYSVFQNILFHSPVKKRKIKYDVSAGSNLPLSFGIFQLYNVNELYPPEKIKDTKEFLHFFRNSISQK